MNSKVKDLKGQAKGKIEAAPVPAFFVGIVLGMIFADYKSSIVPLLFLCGFIYFAFWMLSEQDASSDSMKAGSKK